MKTPAVASPPFDRQDATIILRSSDSIDFRLHRETLAVSSSFFDGLVHIPQPIGSNHSNESSSSQDVPVVGIVEPSAVIDPLLRIIYPTQKPQFQDVRLIGRVLRAAMKYDIPFAEAHLRDCLNKVAKVSPFTTYAIACQLGLEPEAKVAAISASKKGGISWVKENAHITAGSFYRLTRFLSSTPKLQAPLLSMKVFINPPITKSKKQQHLSLSDRSTHRPPIVSADFLGQFPPDIILRSSDNNSFPVHKVFISMVSPVLKDLFADVQQDENSLPSVSISELGGTLANLIRLCYPMCMGRLDIPDLDSLHDLARVINKYQLHAGLECVRGRILTLPELQTNPIRIYYASVQYGWHEEARVAASRFVLMSSPEDPSNVYAPEMEQVSALAMHNLISYFNQCRALIAAAEKERCGRGSKPFLKRYSSLEKEIQSGEEWIRNAVRKACVELCIDLSDLLISYAASVEDRWESRIEEILIRSARVSHCDLIGWSL